MTNVMVSDFADFSIVNVLFQATFPLIRVCLFAFFNRFFFQTHSKQYIRVSVLYLRTWSTWTREGSCDQGVLTTVQFYTWSVILF